MSLITRRDLSALIRNLLQEAEMTQEELAERLSCQQSHISRIVTKDELPDLAVRAARELGADVNRVTMFEYEEE